MVAVCPLHTFECSSLYDGGCCPIGLRCAQSQCLEYEYKTLAVIGSMQVAQQRYPPLSVLTEGTLSSESALSTHTPYTKLTSGESLRHAAISTISSFSHGGKWSEPRKDVDDLPISERTWGKPTAWSAKIGQIAISRGTGKHGRARSIWGRPAWLLGPLAAFAGPLIVL